MVKGIVTKFTMKAHPQGQVWVSPTVVNLACLILIDILQGGLVTITGDHLDAVSNATVKFSTEVTDPKAAVLPTYNSILGIVRTFTQYLIS